MRTFTVLAIVAAALVVSAVQFGHDTASAQTMPTLDYETLRNASEADVQSTCAEDFLSTTATIHYTVSGVATGPYPGTFTEHGTAKVSTIVVHPFTQTGQVLALTATFTITSTLGTVTGQKTFVPGASTGTGRCDEYFSNSIIRATNNLRYTAQLPDGTTDEGHSNLSFYDTSGQGAFTETFRSTRVVTERPPAQRIADLITKVEGFGLHAGVTNSLVVKLQAVGASLGRGNTAAACGQLGAFANEVRAQSGKHIPGPNASALIAEAEAIKQKIGCR